MKTTHKTVVVMAIAAMVAVPAGTAFAQTTINGNLASDGAQRTTGGRLERGLPASICGATTAPPPTFDPANPYSYAVVPMVNAGPARCVTVTVVGSNCTGGQEVFATLYRGSLDPAVLQTNFGARGNLSSPGQAATSGFGVDLNAGETVNVVVFSGSSTGAAPGTCDFAVTSNELQAASITPVPTLGEWAMILFGGLLAGGAALLVQRRRMAV